MLTLPYPMRLGSLYYSSTENSAFPTQRDDHETRYVGGRNYFEPATFCAEFASDWTEPRLPVENRPRDVATDVYREWHQSKSGNFHVFTPNTEHSRAGDEREGPATQPTVKIKWPEPAQRLLNRASIYCHDLRRGHPGVGGVGSSS